MNKALTLLSLISLIVSNVSAMDQEGKPRSCGQRLKASLLEPLNRTVISYTLINRTFAPLTDNEAHQLFDQENMYVTQKLKDLESDEHLTEIAVKAGLSGLAIYETTLLQGSELPDLIKHEAYTGKSVTQFKNGKVRHAIVIPSDLVRMEDTVIRNPILYGVIEREIARISQAYTPNDNHLKQWTRCLKLTGYTIGSLLAYCYDPFTLIATAPVALIAAGWDASNDIFHEINLDAKALALTGNADNLMATIAHTQENRLIRDINVRTAQQAHIRKITPYASLSPNSLRMFLLLQAKTQLDIKDE